MCLVANINRWKMENLLLYQMTRIIKLQITYLYNMFNVNANINEFLALSVRNRTAVKSNLVRCTFPILSNLKSELMSMSKFG